MSWTIEGSEHQLSLLFSSGLTADAVLCAERRRKSHNRTSEARCGFKELCTHARFRQALQKWWRNRCRSTAGLQKIGSFKTHFIVFSIVQSNRTKTKIKQIVWGKGDFYAGTRSPPCFCLFSVLYLFISQLSWLLPPVLPHLCLVCAAPPAVFKVCSAFARLSDINARFRGLMLVSL